jgi:hypothetical protein
MEEEIKCIPSSISNNFLDDNRLLSLRRSLVSPINKI